MRLRSPGILSAPARPPRSSSSHPSPLPLLLTAALTAASAPQVSERLSPTRPRRGVRGRRSFSLPSAPCFRRRQGPGSAMPDDQLRPPTLRPSPGQPALPPRLPAPCPRATACERLGSSLLPTPTVPGTPAGPPHFMLAFCRRQSSAVSPDWASICSGRPRAGGHGRGAWLALPYAAPKQQGVATAGTPRPPCWERAP